MQEEEERKRRLEDEDEFKFDFQALLESNKKLKVLNLQLTYQKK